VLTKEEIMAHTHTVIHRDRSDVDGDYRGEAVDHTTNVAARVIATIGSILVALLGIRFVLMLLGANQGNAIVNFVYTLTAPFAAPFFGMFRYQAQYGIVRFEFETLIAMAFYGLLTWLLVRLVTIGNRRVDV
jgi:hypothetical protein